MKLKQAAWLAAFIIYWFSGEKPNGTTENKLQSKTETILVQDSMRSVILHPLLGMIIYKIAFS